MIFDPKSLPDYADRVKAAELYEAYCRLEDECVAAEGGLKGSLLSIPELQAMAEKRDEALEAYEQCGVELLMDANGDLIRCALTGVPLLSADGDSVWVLAAAVQSGMEPA